MSVSECYWCHDKHSDDVLCAQARTVLDKLREKGATYEQPNVEITGGDDQEVAGTLCLALGVKAFWTTTLDIIRPGLAIQPIHLDESLGKPLILIDDDANIRRAGRMIDDMAGTAVRQARKARDEARAARSG